MSLLVLSPYWEGGVGSVDVDVEAIAWVLLLGLLGAMRMGGGQLGLKGVDGMDYGLFGS